MNIEIFADGANTNTMLELARNPLIRGFTTNPTLMRKSGVIHYAVWAKEVLAEITEHPISFEVIADELNEIERQAHLISLWGKNVFVKIPITTTRGISTLPLIHRLSRYGTQLNVTAIMTRRQILDACKYLSPDTPSYISVFAGRIADTGRDPLPFINLALDCVDVNTKVIWASPREVLNVYQAEAIGCHIITATTDILYKLQLQGKKLEDFSLETVQMFHDDALHSGYKL